MYEYQDDDNDDQHKYSPYRSTNYLKSVRLSTKTTPDPPAHLCTFAAVAALAAGAKVVEIIDTLPSIAFQVALDKPFRLSCMYRDDMIYLYFFFWEKSSAVDTEIFSVAVWFIVREKNPAVVGAAGIFGIHIVKPEFFSAGKSFPSADFGNIHNFFPVGISGNKPFSF